MEQAGLEIALWSSVAVAQWLFQHGLVVFTEMDDVSIIRLNEPEDCIYIQLLLVLEGVAWTGPFVI
jgi:hypothetical protein